MISQPTIEAMDDHRYLVRATQDDDVVDVSVRVDPDFGQRLGITASGPEIVGAAMAFLLQRQRMDDLPAQLDLEDIAAAYGEFAERLRSALDASGIA